MAGARNPELSKVARMPVIQLLNQGFSALPLSRGVGCPARLPSPEDSRSGSASSWVSRVGRSFSFWNQGATHVELSSSKWPSAGALLRAVGTTTQGSGQAGVQFLQPPQSAGQSAVESLWETFRSEHCFSFVYYLEGQGGEVIVFYQGASKLL